MKKTKARAKKLEKDKKKHERKLKRREQLLGINYSFPIDQIYNPQTFTEQLFGRLKACKFPFGVKTNLMNLIARMIGRHRLIIPSFYPYLQKYLKYGNKEVGKIFAYLAEAVHVNVPQSDLEPILKFIIMNFANESCPDVKISMGLNCITQMCARKPLLIEEEDLKFLCELSKYKEKNVNRAVKCLINLYRDLDPTMLHKNYRGRRDEMDAKDDGSANYLGKRLYLQGVSDISHRVEGAELLGEDTNGKQIETERFLTNEDLRRIKKIKRKQVYKRELKKFAEDTTGEKAMAKPGFDIIANRDKLKAITMAVAHGDLAPEDVEKLDSRIEEEGLAQWEEQIDDFVDYEDSDDADSSEDLSKPYDRNHGFLSSEDMLKFIPNKQRRLEQAKLEMKLKKMRTGKMTEDMKARGKKTNRTKAKNKPYMMVADKFKHQAVDLFDKIRKTKNQLGKVSKRLTNKVKNKKNSAKVNKGKGRR